jgi:hypothetical protein
VQVTNIPDKTVQSPVMRVLGPAPLRQAGKRGWEAWWNGRAVASLRHLHNDLRGWGTGCMGRWLDKQATWRSKQGLKGVSG